MAAFHELADTLLTEFGFDLIVNNYANDHFDVDKGENVKLLDNTETGHGVFTQLNAGELKENGYNFQDGDIKILLSVPEYFNVDISTEVIINEEKYSIKFIQEVKDHLITALYKVVLRKKQ